MARRGDRTCFVCRKAYHYCLCHGGNPNETWRFLYCSENCMQVEKVWEDYFRDGIITRDEAVERISALDTSRAELYRDQVRDDLISIIPSSLVHHIDEEEKLLLAIMDEEALEQANVEEISEEEEY